MGASRNNGMFGYNYLTFAAIGVIVALVAGYAIFSFILPTTSNTANVATVKNFFLSLTDPATVPTGTSALYVTYSALQLSVLYNGSTSTQALPGSGTVNVLDLQNSSIVLAATHIPNGSKVTRIKVNISSAVITVDGENSSVVIGEGTLTINLTTKNTISGRQSGLIDLVPSVTAIETVDKTVYVLTASVRAVIVPANVFAGQSMNVQPNGNHSYPSTPPLPGAHINFSSNVSLGKLFNSVTPTVKIIAASIVVTGNDTSFSMTVQNTGNSSVELNGIMVNGTKNVYFPQPNPSVLFQLPTMIMPLPITPPAGMPTPPGFVPPPKMIITFPNGTVMNTTSTFMPPPIQTQPPINGTMPPPNSTSNISAIVNMPGTTVSLSGTFYLLKIVTPAHAISLNSTGVLINVSGDIIYKTTTMPQFIPPNQQNGSQSQGLAPNITIPSGSVAVTLPMGTTLFMQFPPGMTPPTVTPPPQMTSQAAKFPVGRMIFPNGTLGFPAVSATALQSHQIASSQQAQSVNGITSSVIANGATNLNVTITPDMIPKGYVLAPGDTATFTLNGLLYLGPSPQVQNNNAAEIQPPFAVLVSGEVYTINLFGMGGVHAMTQTTAS